MEPPGDHVEVTGTGAVVVRPDVLQAAVGAEATGPDVATALTSAQDAAAAMATAARAGGVADADLGSSDMSVQTHHDDHGRPAGFRAWLGLSVTLRDLGSAGETLSAVLVAGGDQARVHAVSLLVSDQSDASDRARVLAFAEARHQAEQLAGLAGRGLGAVLKVTSEPTYGGAPGWGRQSAPMSAGRASSVPVEGGAATVTATVRVVFALTSVAG